VSLSDRVKMEQCHAIPAILSGKVSRTEKLLMCHSPKIGQILIEMLPFFFLFEFILRIRGEETAV
jgi:hypothetical protein